MQRLTEAYAIVSTLFENESTIIYRAVRQADGRPVILKTHKRREDIHKIRHEYDLLKALRIDGISNVIDIFNNNEDPTFLVSEDHNAVVLESYLHEHPVLTEDELLRLAENAARALASIHAHRIIHRDIKPANMLVNPETLEIWYIDFGISVQIKRGYDFWQDTVEGTLEYISPEQTGRVNRPIDYRADIYSLGVTLYRMATGAMPFTGSNTMELIHAHIATTPVPPIELVGVQPIISAGLLKMLEKKPENRYQTADSLAYDIARCRRLIAEGKDCNAFRLAEKDIFYNLEPGHKLYGKITALEDLQRLFDDVSATRAEIVLLDGGESSGKTMILNEFERYAAKQNGLVFRADYQQQAQGESYHALRSAFAHFDSLVYGSKISLSTYRDMVLQALGDNAQALIDILPQLETVLGKQPPVPRLGPVENQVRAEQVFSTFLQVLCSVPFPCAFLFDNAQWADDASLRLLFSAFEDTRLKNCILILSFRDDDLATGERLRRFLSSRNMRHNGISTIHIQALTQADIVGIVQDIFPQDRESAEALAAIVYENTGGTMRRIEAYLKELYHGGIIYYDEAEDGWRWKRDAINPAADPLREETQGAYDTLPKETIHVVNRLLCFGLSCTREELDVLFAPEMTHEAVMRAIEPVIGIGYVQHDEQTDVVSIQGNRLRQAAYTVIPQADREREHALIARRLYDHYADDEGALLTHCVQITEQFGHANPRDLTGDDRANLIALNRLAGEKAMETANMDKAARCFAVAMQYLGEDAFAANYAQAVDIHLRYGASLFAIGRIEEATALFRAVIDHAQNENDRYEAYYALIRQHLAIADWLRAEAYIAEYLQGRDVLPQGEDAAAVQEAEKARFMQYYHEKGIEHFLYAKMSEDPAVLRCGSLMAILCEASVINMNPRALGYIYRTLNYAYEHSLFPEFERTLALMAERYADMGEYDRAHGIFKVGVAFAEKYDRPQCVLWAVYCSTILHWVAPVSDVPEVFQKVKHMATAEGNLYYSAFADLMLLCYHLFTGTSLNRLARDVEAAIYNVDKSNYQRFRVVFASTFRQFVRCMTGRTNAMDSFDDRTFLEAEAEASTDAVRWHYNAQFYYVYRMQALYTNGYFEQVLACAEKYLRYDRESAGLYSAFLSRAQFYYYYALAMIRICQDDRTRTDAYMPAIREAMQKLRTFAQAQPDNFEAKYKLVELEMSRISYFDLSMINALSDIDTRFREMNCLWDRSIIEESLMDFWKQRGIYQYRDMHGRNALEIYRALGAKLKVMELAGLDAPEVQTDSATISSTTILTSTGLSMTSDTTYSASLDYQAILNVITCLVSEDNIDDLLERLLALLMENGGADQALLFLLENGAIQLRSFRFADRHAHGLMRQALPLAMDQLDRDTVPHKLIELSMDKKMQLVANTADNEYRFLADPYLEKHAPESFICLPILAREKLLGVIYLENAQLPGVFPPPRVSFLDTIVLQASLLIQNALEVNSLEGYTEDLEKRLTSYVSQLNTLIAGIAHEINSPLGVCVTVATRLLERNQEVGALYAQRQLSKSALDDYLQEDGAGLDILTNNITRASDLVQNFKKISVNQSSEVFEELELMQTLRNIAEYIRPAVKKVIARCDITGPQTLMLYTSTGVLAQIFTNLIMNSSIHAFGGMEKEDCIVTIDVSEDEDNVHIVYADNGRGMSAEEKEKIFMPFFTTRRSEGGSGLGGHIIMTLITQTLHGAVHCISTPGRGTSFIIRLPKNLAEIEEESNHVQ